MKPLKKNQSFKGDNLGLIKYVKRLKKALKRRNIHLSFVLLIFFAGMFIACRKYTYQTAYPTLVDGEYDSEFPYKDCSEQLEKIANSVKRIYSVAYYETLFFNENESVNTENLRIKIRNKRYYQDYKSSQSISGSATLIYNKNNRLAYLTCAHNVSFTDTVITFYDKGTGLKSIFSVTIKVGQEIFTNNIPGDRKLEILCSDNVNDIAIIGKTCEITTDTISAFSYAFGDSKKLKWGSFVYIFGFPIGRPMITKGIVSNPNFDNEGSYILDAVFNEGISGGPVLAVKDGVPNFEIVGVAKTAAAKYNNILVPEKKSEEYIYNPSITYDEKAYASLQKQLYYGITFAVPTTKIIEMYIKNRETLINKGYNLDTFFNFKQ